MPVAASELEQHRSYLTAYALRRVGDAGLAEDLVQDTYVAALGAVQGFRGDASLRTWLTGILKHKIIDAIRRASRDGAAAAGEEDANLDEVVFNPRGHWATAQPAWPDPDASLEQAQFFAVLEECLARLPAKTAQAFMMREHLGLETADICKELGVTPTHCWVLLYRARMSLRECLQANWFGAR